jgi:hypothetical protein
VRRKRISADNTWLRHVAAIDIAEDGFHRAIGHALFPGRASPRR